MYIPQALTVASRPKTTHKYRRVRLTASNWTLSATDLWSGDWQGVKEGEREIVRIPLLACSRINGSWSAPMSPTSAPHSVNPAPRLRRPPPESGAATTKLTVTWRRTNYYIIMYACKKGSVVFTLFYIYIYQSFLHIDWNRLRFNVSNRCCCWCPSIFFGQRPPCPAVPKLSVLWLTWPRICKCCSKNQFVNVNCVHKVSIKWPDLKVTHIRGDNVGKEHLQF